MEGILAPLLRPQLENEFEQGMFLLDVVAGVPLLIPGLLLAVLKKKLNFTTLLAFMLVANAYVLGLPSR